MSVNLTLNLKKEYFLEIKNGTKLFEYRLFNDYWKKRLLNKHYDVVIFKLGYPSNDDLSKIIKKEYLGYQIEMIQHKHFGETPVIVFSILTTGKILI